jgi:hypothetical protein
MAQRVNVAIRIVFHWGATRPSAIPFIQKNKTKNNFIKTKKEFKENT